MLKLVRRLAGAGVVVAMMTLSGCSQPDLSPVPPVADHEFICDGVSREGIETVIGESDIIELMTGEIDLEAESRGGWSEDPARFSCVVQDAGSERSPSDSIVFVHLTRAEGMGYYDDKEFLDEYADAEPITTDHPGVGFVVVGNASLEAWWLCNDILLKASGYDLVPTRNRAADMEAFMVSMLPWACGGEDAPPSTS